MTATLLSFLQMERGTLPTSRMWMDVRFAAVVDMLPKESGVGHKSESIAGSQRSLPSTT